jgi:hypothetical protein
MRTKKDSETLLPSLPYATRFNKSISNELTFAYLLKMGIEGYDRHVVLNTDLGDQQINGWR